MGQRQRTQDVTPRAFKYTSVAECEENEDFHVYRAKVWPPRRTANQIEEPSVGGRCELCGCNLVVYPGHATGELPGIKVILPT